MKFKHLLRTITVIILFFVTGNLITGQVAGDFRSLVSGNWSSTASWERYSSTDTWEAFGVGENTTTGLPASASSVFVLDGHTITIDQDVSITKLTIGQGVTGILQYENTTTVRTLTLAGDLVIKTGAAFNLGTQSSNVEHLLNLAGNVSIEDLATLNIGNGSSKGVITNFNNATSDDQTISSSGTPASVTIGKIKLNRPNSTDKVICSVSMTSKAGNLAFQLLKGTWEQSAGTWTGPSTTSSNLYLDQPNGILSLSGSGSMSLTGSIVGIGGSNGFEGGLTINTSGSLTVASLNSNGRLQNTNGALNVQSGTINIGGRFLLSGGTTTISGGNINISPQGIGTALGATSNSFEIAAGTFNMSGGSVTVVCPNAASTTGRDIKFRSAATYNVTGGNIYLGDGVNTLISTSTTFAGYLISCDAGVSVYNLVLQTGGIAGRDAGLASDLLNTGTLTLTSGKLDLRSSRITLNNPIAGTATNLVGTNTASITIAGAASGINIPSSIAALNNLTINNSNGTELGSDLTVEGTLTMMNGALSLGTYTLTYGTNTTLAYAGATAQISGVEFLSLVPKLTLNNSAGLTLTSSKTVSGTLTLSAGKLDIGAYDLTIGNTGSITGNDASNYIVTSGIGFLRMNTLGTVGSVTYPVGPSGTSYTPYVSTDNTSTDLLGVRIKNSISNATLDNEKCVKLEWQANEGVAGGNNGTVTFQWNASEHGTSFDPSQPVLFGTWDGNKYTTNSVIVNGTGPYTVTIDGPETYPSYPVIFGNEGAFPASGYKVTFTIKEGTNLLSGADVTFKGTTKTTAADGIAEFSGISAETGITFTVSKTGYKTENGTIDVVSSDVSKEVVMTAKSNDATLSTLTVSTGTLSPVFASGTLTYTVVLPYGSTQVPTVSATTTDVNAGKVITQATNVTGNEAERTAKVVVTAEDGVTEKTYSVVFSVAKNNATDILSFNFTAPAVVGTVNATNHTVGLSVPSGTALTALVPTITLSPGATVSPASGVATNFTSAVNYTVNAEDGTTSQIWTVTVTLPTGIENDVVRRFKIYPNPFNEEIKIEGIEKPSHVSIFSLSGQVLLEKKLNYQDNSINTNSLKSGIYMISIENENGERVTQRIIKK